MPELPERNLALDLVRVTEAAALAAGRWMGRGEKIAADQAAVDAMRLVLNTIEMEGVIVIGEGEKDDAPMLYNGERLGTGEPPVVDIAVDPIDGTTLTATGRSGALSVVALAPSGSMYAPGKLVYMNKIAVGPEARPHRHRCAGVRQSQGDRTGQAPGRGRSDGHDPGSAPSRATDQRCARGRRTDSPHP